MQPAPPPGNTHISPSEEVWAQMDIQVRNNKILGTAYQFCGYGSDLSRRCRSGSGSDFYFDADPDPVSRQSNAYLRPLVYRPSTAAYWASTPLLWASTALHLLHIELHSSWILPLMRIRILFLLWCGSGSCFSLWWGSGPGSGSSY